MAGDRNSIARYAVAFISTALAAFLTHVLASLGDAGISPLFFGAVFISAWYGGLGPGLLTTIMSGIATAYLLIPEHGSFAGGVAPYCGWLSSQW